MTIEAAYSPDQYAGNDVTMTFAVSFPFFDEDEIEVIITDDATGVETGQVLNTDYSVSGGGVALPADGEITFLVTAPATGETVTIRRVTDRLQAVDLTRGGALAPDSVEGALDRAIMLAQEAEEALGRCLRVPKSDDPSLDMELPSQVDRASTYSGFDENGEPIPLGAPTGTSLTTPWSEILLQDPDAPSARETILGTGDEGDALIYSGGDSGFAPIPLPPAHLNGLEITRTSATQLDVGKGRCRAGSSTDQNLVNGVNTNAAFGKLFDNGGWDAGDGGGGVPAAAGFAAAAATWHFFILVAQDGSAYDFGYDTSASAVNLIADAGVVAALGGSCYYRRIFSFRSSATPDIPDFTQNGDEVILAAAVHSGSTASLASANRTLFALDVPGDIKVEALFNAYTTEAAAHQVYLTSPDQDDESCDVSVGRVSLCCAAGAGQAQAGAFRLRTNTSRQIGARANADAIVDLELSTYGWIDRRGRDD